MSLDVWFHDDVVRALNAARIANREAIRTAGQQIPRQAIIQPGESLDLVTYCRGFEAALQTIAVAFGVGTNGE